jgi:plasmid stabilization system protein ParE
MLNIKGRCFSTLQPRKENIEMPRGVKEGSKRDRQYEHIKDSYEDRGVSEKEAEERAARTVNKERREHGETKEQRGNSNRNS